MSLGVCVYVKMNFWIEMCIIEFICKWIVWIIYWLGLYFINEIYNRFKIV